MRSALMLRNERQNGATRRGNSPVAYAYMRNTRAIHEGWSFASRCLEARRIIHQRRRLRMLRLSLVSVYAKLCFWCRPAYNHARSTNINEISSQLAYLEVAPLKKAKCIFPKCRNRFRARANNICGEIYHSPSYFFIVEKLWSSLS